MTSFPIVVVPTGLPDPHDSEVLLRVNRFLDGAYSALPKGTTVSEYLDWAQCEAEKARPGPHDLAARDAEYYLKCRYEVSTYDWTITKFTVSMGGGGLNLLYNGLKLVAIGFGFEERMRTDKAVPVTPPGGITWGHKGCMDAMQEDGKSVKKPTPASFEPLHSFPLPTTLPSLGAYPTA